MKIKAIIFSLLISISLPFLDIVTFKYTCDYMGDGGPDFFGFPFIDRTSIPWVNSFEGDFYILGYFGNFIFWFLVVILLISLFNRIKMNMIIKKIAKVIGYILTIIFCLLAFINFAIIEWRYEWKNTYINRDYRGKPLKCERHIEFLKQGM